MPELTQEQFNELSRQLTAVVQAWLPDGVGWVLVLEDPAWCEVACRQEPDCPLVEQIVSDLTRAQRRARDGEV